MITKLLISFIFLICTKNYCFFLFFGKVINNKTNVIHSTGDVMYNSVLIIADDLTGATDTGLQFQEIGLSTVSTSKKSKIPTLLNEYDVVSINTNTRQLEKKEAYKKIKSLCEKVKNYKKNTLIYKKVDSTLRGNIKTEINAIKDTLSFDLMIFAPAYPKQKRKTRQGIHKIKEKPIHETEYIDDIDSLSNSSKLAKYFSDFEASYDHIKLEELNKKNLKSIVENHDLLSFDVTKDKDLKKIVLIGQNLSYKRILWVGSAGLAKQIANNFLKNKISKKSVLLAIGSTRSLARDQMKNFIEKGAGKKILVKIRPLIENYEEEKKRILKKTSKAINNCEDPVITTSYREKQINEGKKLASEMKISMKKFKSILRDKFSLLICFLINHLGKENISGIITSGGDISYSVLKKLDIDPQRIVGSIESGIPVLQGNGWMIVTKAGGFGTPNLFLKASAKIKGWKSD